MNKPNLNGIGMTSQRTRERLLGRLMEQGVKNLQVLDLMRSMPRHIFLDEAMSHRAYEDVALPIGFGQTISQPYIVARMTEALLSSGSVARVLEVGTGCGYQTAVLARLADKVYSVERIKPLLDKARANLRLLGARNVELKHDDGNLGWRERAPFDGILAAAAPKQVPPELLEQLAEGGRLVIPVGSDHEQELYLITRRGDEFESRVLERVRFVPLLAGRSKG